MSSLCENSIVCRKNSYQENCMTIIFWWTIKASCIFYHCIFTNYSDQKPILFKVNQLVHTKSSTKKICMTTSHGYLFIILQFCESQCVLKSNINAYSTTRKAWRTVVRNSPSYSFFITKDYKMRFA